jgi:hypothetical protein
MDQRVNIEFCLRTGQAATETFQLIKQACGDSAVSRTLVFELYAGFRDGCEISKMTNAVVDQQPFEHLT